MIPSAWQFGILTLATFRVFRLVSTDDVPPLPRLRNWLVGATETKDGWKFKRPTLAHWLQCGWCAGAWASCLVAALWFITPEWTLRVAVFPALSGAVGLLFSKTHD